MARDMWEHCTLDELDWMSDMKAFDAHAEKKRMDKIKEEAEKNRR